MSFLPPEQQNQNAPQGQTSPIPGGATPMGGGSAGAATGAPKAGSSNPPPSPSVATPNQFGSSASNLGAYLSANAPQIQNQANSVTQGLNNQYNQVNTDIGSAANQFGQQVQSGYTAPNQDVVNQATSNPTQFASDPNNVAAFQQQYNDTYSGPTSYESSQPYTAIQGEVNNAVQNAGLLNTQAGLQNYFAGNAGPNQTKATNTLDTLLLQGNPGAEAQIQEAANQFQQLNPAFQNSVTSANKGVTAAQQAAQQAQQYATNQINPVAQNFQTGLNTGVTNANIQRDAYNQALAQLQAQGTSLVAPINAVNEAAPSLGLTNYFQDIPGMSPVINPATAANTASSGQYAEDAALAQLLGQNYTPSLNQTNIGQAGTFQTPGSTPNFNNLLQQQVANLGQKYRQQTYAGQQANGAQWSTPFGEENALENLAGLLNKADPNYNADYTSLYTGPNT